MMSTTKQSIPLLREEALQAQPNKQVFRFEPNTRRAYPVHYFCDNKEGIHNKNTYAVCIYHRAWYQVKPDQHTGEPVLGELALAIHTHDIEDEDRSSQQSSNNKQQMDPVNDKIRRSPATISPIQLSAPMMLATWTSPVITVMARGSGTPPPRQGTPPPVVGATPASIQSRMNAVLRHIRPPGGGGGGPGGPGRPGGPVGGLQVPQQPVMPAGDIKTMGQLPQIFTGNQAQADNFIEEVKGYLCLN
jgi:hypothetical protein